jgi:hypothetical protein
VATLKPTAKLIEHAIIELPLDGESGPWGATPIGIADSIKPLAVLEQALKHEIGHVIQRSGLAYDKELKTADIMISTPEIFLTFPAATIMQPEQVNAKTEKKLKFVSSIFRSIEEKPAVMDMLRQSMSDLIHKDLTGEVILVADELYTNAVRASDLKKNPKPSEIFLAGDEDRILVCCIDPCGSLEPMSMIRMIRRCFDGQRASIFNQGSRGGGLGGFMMFQSCVGFYMAVREGERTVVALTLSKKPGRVNRLKTPKNLHQVRIRVSA